MASKGFSLEWLRGEAEQAEAVLNEYGYGYGGGYIVPMQKGSADVDQTPGSRLHFDDWEGVKGASDDPQFPKMLNLLFHQL